MNNLMLFKPPRTFKIHENSQMLLMMNLMDEYPLYKPTKHPHSTLFSLANFHCSNTYFLLIEINIEYGPNMGVWWV